MVGGFAAAGVKYVISCLWTADDFASAVLMAEFYRQYKGRKLSPPAALRAAKKKSAAGHEYKSLRRKTGLTLH